MGPGAPEFDNRGRSSGGVGGTLCPFFCFTFFTPPPVVGGALKPASPQDRCPRRAFRNTYRLAGMLSPSDFLSWSAVLPAVLAGGATAMSWRGARLSGDSERRHSTMWGLASVATLVLALIVG